jgi:hypothetical protein
MATRISLRLKLKAPPIPPISNDNKFINYIKTLSDSRQLPDTIKYLKSPEVIKWLFGTKIFTGTNITTRQKLENQWGGEIIGRPIKQWTTELGECCVKEILILLGHSLQKVTTVNHHRIDIITNTHIVEVKTKTYNTNGTAGERLLAVPFKYIDLPDIYNKPLWIVCVAKNEVDSRNNYGNLPGPVLSNSKKLQKKYKDFKTDDNIEFIGLTDLMNQLTANAVLV